MELSGQLQLLHTTVLVDDGVLVLGPSEGQEFVVMVDGKLGAIVAKILNNFLVGGLLGLRVRTLQVRVAVMLLNRRVVSVKGVGLVLGVPLVWIRMLDGMTAPGPTWVLRGANRGVVVK